MTGGPYIAHVAALIGDPARANILVALMGGQALTATELASAAGVTPQTTSGHLAKLTDGRLLTFVTQGRHRYYRLATVEVARMLEGLMAVSSNGPPRHRPRSVKDDALAAARTCYDHLAGRLGVAVADALVSRELVILGDDGGELTSQGHIEMTKFDAQWPGTVSNGRMICRPCLDWSERRWHIGGALGAAVARRCFHLGWVARIDGGRALQVTLEGKKGLQNSFGIDWTP